MKFLTLAALIATAMADPCHERCSDKMDDCIKGCNHVEINYKTLYFFMKTGVKIFFLKSFFQTYFQACYQKCLREFNRSNFATTKA